MKTLGHISGQRGRETSGKRRISLIASAIISAVIIVAVGGMAAASNTPVQITDNEMADQEPKINDSGQVVWLQRDGNDDEIFLYTPGVGIQQLTDNDVDDRDHQISNSGQVVWTSWLDFTTAHVLLYTPGQGTVQISESGESLNGMARINENGQVVWSRYIQGEVPMTTILLYTPGVGITQIAQDDGWVGYPDINDSGQICWFAGDDSDTDMEMFLYSPGTGVQQLTDTPIFEVLGELNNAGQVTWISADLISETASISLYTPGTGVQVLSDTPGLSSEYGFGGGMFPQINDSGQVTWLTFDGSNYKLMLYTAGLGASQLTFTDGLTSTLDINNSGQIVWDVRDGGNEPEIFLYSPGSGVEQLTDNYDYDMAPRINNKGDITWSGIVGNNYEILLRYDCSGDKPSLSLSHDDGYWASYDDYTARALSVDYGLLNNGSNGAYDVEVVGSANSAGVTSVNTPLAVGSISWQGGARVTVRYSIPEGVSAFITTVYVTAGDECGSSYSYPGPYGGA